MNAIADLVRRVIPGQPRHVAIGVDEFFDLVSSDRRQFVLLYLDGDESDGTATVAELANRLAIDQVEAVTSLEDITERQRKRYYVSLYQTHLPKLDESGLIEWDRDSATVTPTPETAPAAAAVRDMRAAMNLDYRVYDTTEFTERQITSGDIVNVLSSARRRHLISLLADAEPGATVTLDWLARSLTEIEAGENYNSDDRKRVYVGLYQHHLPRMDSLGIVEYEQGEPVVVTDRVRVFYDVMLVGEAVVREVPA